MIPIGTKFTFHSPYASGPDDFENDEWELRKGTQAVVIAHHTTNSPTHDFDEVGPMYGIQFLADGVEISAWPEEVE